MDEHTRTGYIKLLRDLAKLDHPEHLQDMIARGQEAVSDLDKLIERVRRLANQKKRPDP